MAIIKEVITGTKILNDIKSSNIVKSEYDTQSQLMIVEFLNGSRFQYEKVPHKIYTQFRLAESQGKFFSSKIAKGYSYKKL